MQTYTSYDEIKNPTFIRKEKFLLHHRNQKNQVKN